MTVIRRQELLHILYSSLKDHSNILMRRKVVRIGHTNSGVSVWTTDGSVYHGDTVVGTDGVHSVTRSEVWRIANSEKPGFIPPADKTSKCCLAVRISARIAKLTLVDVPRFDYRIRCRPRDFCWGHRY